MIGYLKKEVNESISYLVSNINKLLKEFDAGRINKNNKIIKDLTNIFFSLEKVDNSSVDVSKIFTIHSVKGEILKISYGELKASNTELERVARNLLYVALSRAKYLVVLSISENELTPELKEKMERDWNLVSTITIIQDAEKSFLVD